MRGNGEGEELAREDKQNDDIVSRAHSTRRESASEARAQVWINCGEKRKFRKIQVEEFSSANAKSTCDYDLLSALRFLGRSEKKYEDRKTKKRGAGGHPKGWGASISRRSRCAKVGRSGGG